MRFLRLSILFVVCAGLTGLGFAATPKNRAQSNPVTVLELFTSQGCSSCPAANKFVRETARANNGVGDVLTLSYSVDYWDYLGWKDTFGKPEFSAHQRAYGVQFDGQVYTPQMVINGAVHSARFSNKKVRAHTLDNRPKITIVANGDMLNIHIRADPTGKKPLNVMTVRYQPGIQSVPVKRGENRGRTISLANVVQACKEIGYIKTGGSFDQQIPIPTAGEAIVIIVQDGKGGPILSAANFTP